MMVTIGTLRPGTFCARSVTLITPEASSSSPVSTVIASGVFCAAVAPVLVAVTMISGNVSTCAAAGLSCAATTVGSIEGHSDLVIHGHVVSCYETMLGGASHIRKYFVLIPVDTNGV